MNSQYFGMPFREKVFVPPTTINRAAVVDKKEEVLAQLMSLEDQLHFIYFLKSFFLNIFEMILTPIKLMLLLVQEFFVEPSLNLSASERKVVQDTKLRDLKDRVLLFLETWIKKREKDFLLGSAEVLELLVCFIEYIRNRKEVTSHFKYRISSLLEQMNRLKKEKLRLAHSFTRHYLSNQKCSEGDKMILHYEKRLNEEVNILDFFLLKSNHEIAMVLFMIDAKIFMQMSVYELNPRRIDNTGERSSSYNSYLSRLNTFIFLYIYMILYQKDYKSRLLMIKKLVCLARILRTTEPVDMEGYYQIRLAFKHPAISELKSYHQMLLYRGYKDGLSEEELQEYKLLIRDERENIHKQMAEFKQAEVPYIPSLRPFAQFLSRANARTDIIAEEKVSIDQLHSYSDIYNFLEKIMGSDRTKEEMIKLESLKYTPLYYFLEKGYLNYLMERLHLTELNSMALEKALYNHSKFIRE